MCPYSHSLSSAPDSAEAEENWSVKNVWHELQICKFKSSCWVNINTYLYFLTMRISMAGKPQMSTYMFCLLEVNLRWRRHRPQKRFKLMNNPSADGENYCLLFTMKQQFVSCTLGLFLNPPCWFMSSWVTSRFVFSFILRILSRLMGEMVQGPLIKVCLQINVCTFINMCKFSALV